MVPFKIGDIIKIKVIGEQHYGLFVRSLDDETYTGLIHISEISTEFIKDISKVAKIDDILFAKILDIDEKNKHIKLSIKACSPKTRYRFSNYKINNIEEPAVSFVPLQENLSYWIQEQLKEKKGHD